MIMSKKFTTANALAKFLRGSLVSSGTTTTLSGDSFIDTAADFTTDGIAVGDAVYISGEKTALTIESISSTAETAKIGFTLSADASGSAGANYRICTDQIAASDVLSISFDSASSTWSLIWDGIPGASF